ncbi:MAG: hypothetical protein BGO55_15355 [Sphingobacteriales bacterium 50-39]|nr:MAG: hypothetical protein BGO55_15355 [Sphingobacteriales bacterium 50-39]
MQGPGFYIILALKVKYPMKLIITPLVAILVLSATSPDAFCQDSAKIVKIKESALLFADSLIKTDVYENWSVYADLAPASVLKYYGGKEGFINNAQKIHPRTVSSFDLDFPERKVLALLESTSENQWQCVIKESRNIYRDDNKKYHLVTYLLGQSKDGGETWRMFDVSYNTVANIIYMMPDVMLELPIPQPYIMSEEDELAKAKQEAAETAATKRTAPKKK